SVSLNPSGGVYVAGTTVTLTAQANSGWRFSSWSGAISSTQNPVSVVMSTNRVITANFVDIQGPQVNISTPSNNAVVSGVVNIVANVADNVGVSKVLFYIDDVCVSTDTTSPYSYSWDTRLVSNTTYTIRVVGYDTTGNNGYAQIVVNVHNSNYKLMVEVLPENTYGRVLLNPSLDSYLSGTTVSLTAEAYPSNKFVSWAGSIQSVQNPYIITIATYDVTVYSLFIEEDWHVLNIDRQWYNLRFSTQTGKFKLSFKAKPLWRNLDVPIGISYGTAESYTDLACIVRFYTNGLVDVRDAGSYRADLSYGYDMYVEYKITFDVDITNKVYDVYISSGYGDTKLASGYKFRTEQSETSQLNNFAGRYNRGPAGVAIKDVEVYTEQVSSGAYIRILSPVDGAKVSGDVTIQIEAFDDTGNINQVIIYIDDICISTITTHPYNYIWDTKEVSNGTHTIKVTANSSSGKFLQTNISVVVYNEEVSSDSPPVVKILSPVNNSTVSGNVKIQVDITDDNGVNSVLFYVDDVCISTVTSLPYEYTLNTTFLSNSTHTIKVEAYDIKGQVGYDLVIVTVVNLEEDTPPAIVALKGLENKVSGVVKISVEVEDDVGIDKVDLYLGDKLLVSLTQSPYEFNFDSTKYDNGLYTIVVVVYDTSGQTSQESYSFEISNVFTTAQIKLNYVITPNGDGINDYIDFSWVNPEKIKIYNVKGELIKELNPTSNWQADGLDTGIYFYKAKDKYGKIFVLK
ncbi:MAG: Ig-like domain-containing protein, partial [Sulfolobales archaeon]